MKEGWEYSTIGNLCDKMNGLWKGKIGPLVKVGVIRNANFTKAFTLSFDNIEYLDVEAKQYKTRKLVKGDLIVEKSGGSEKQPVGRTVLFDKEEGEYSFSNFTSVLRIKDRNIISPEFLYKYILFVYLRGDTRKMQKATTGIHNIEFDKFLSIPVPTPPISEQQSIVDYLDSAFAKIDTMKANAEKALSEAKALFQASLKEMLEPKEGWNSMKLGDFAYMKAGDFVKASDIYQNYAEGLYPCYGGNGFRGYVKEPNQEGDFCLIGRQGALCGCVNRAKGIFRTTEHAVIVKPYQEIPTSLVYYLLNHLNLNKYATGAAQPGLSVKNIAEQVIITVPPISEQKTIVDTLDSLKSKVDKLQENYDKISQECDALKQAILRQVFE